MEKLTKKDLFDLFENLNKLSNLKGVKFSYAVARNSDIIKRELKAIEESLKPSDEFIKYDEERVELAKLHSEKDDKGNPKTIVENRQEKFVMKDDTKFKKELEKLRKIHKDTLDKRQKQVDEYLAFLETDSDIELFKIKLSDVPEDISVEQMQGIQVLIEDGK